MFECQFEVTSITGPVVFSVNHNWKKKLTIYEAGVFSAELSGPPNSMPGVAVGYKAEVIGQKITLLCGHSICSVQS
jgi:hypothetical protein